MGEQSVLVANYQQRVDGSIVSPDSFLGVAQNLPIRSGGEFFHSSAT